jgi:hypothetical protein
VRNFLFKALLISGSLIFTVTFQSDLVNFRVIYLICTQQISSSSSLFTFLNWTRTRENCVDHLHVYTSSTYGLDAFMTQWRVVAAFLVSTIERAAAAFVASLLMIRQKPVALQHLGLSSSLAVDRFHCEQPDGPCRQVLLVLEPIVYRRMFWILYHAFYWVRKWNTFLLSCCIRRSHQGIELFRRSRKLTMTYFFLALVEGLADGCGRLLEELWEENKCVKRVCKSFSEVTVLLSCAMVLDVHNFFEDENCFGTRRLRVTLTSQKIYDIHILLWKGLEGTVTFNRPL